LDVVLGGTTNGTRVQLWDCNGSDAQQWSVRSPGVLVNLRSGRCLDDPDNRQRVGDPLQIWDCNTTSAQRFRLQ
ncbi:MAG: ricin-type beta-trefoil lectin domain protein, partial [bacterium]